MFYVKSSLLFIDYVLLGFLSPIKNQNTTKIIMGDSIETLIYRKNLTVLRVFLDH